MTLAAAFLAELKEESRATRRLLERVPENKMTWKPHDKSMSLAQLAQHVATSPGEIVRIAQSSNHDMSGFTPPAPPTSNSELMRAFDDDQARAETLLGQMSDEMMSEDWRLTMNGETILNMPRAALIRTIALNHLYHHRGQLTVYLRMLDVPLPSVYGPTADEKMSS